MEVAEQQDRLAGRVIGVAFAPWRSVAGWAGGLPAGLVVLCDPDREAYRAFGFGRSGWRALVHATYWRRLASALRRGRRLRAPTEDPRQLGGDVVLDRDLTVRWIHRSRFPADRPTVEQVVAALRDAADGRA